MFEVFLAQVPTTLEEVVDAAIDGQRKVVSSRDVEVRRFQDDVACLGEWL